MRIVILIIIQVFLLSSCGNHGKESQLSIKTTLENSDKTLSNQNNKNKELVETILNMPNVLKFSKSELVRNKFDSVYIYFKNDSLGKWNLSYRQNSQPILYTSNIVDVETSTVPYYVFDSLKIEKDNAHVLMFFDLTGLVVEGNLMYTNEKWIPSKNIKIGVR